MNEEEIYNSKEYADLLSYVAKLNLDGVKANLDSEWMKESNALKVNILSDLTDAYSIPVLLACWDIMLSDENLRMDKMEAAEQAKYKNVKKALEEMKQYCRKKLRNIGEPLDFSRYQGEFGWCSDPNNEDELMYMFETDAEEDEMTKPELIKHLKTKYPELDVELKLAAERFHIGRVKVLMDYGANPMQTFLEYDDDSYSVYTCAGLRASVQWMEVENYLFDKDEFTDVGDALFGIVSCAAHLTLLNIITPYLEKEDGKYVRPKKAPGYNAFYGEFYSNSAENNYYDFSFDIFNLEGNCKYSFGETLAKIKDVPDIPEKEIIDMFSPEKILEYREYLEHKDEEPQYDELDAATFKLIVTTPLGEFLELDGPLSHMPAFLPESLRRQYQERVNYYKEED